MKVIPLTQGYETVVDDADHPRLSQIKWCAARLGPKRDIVYAHGYNPHTKIRIGMQHFLMDPPIGMEVDHRDGNTLNNRRSNLRICTHADNLRNSRKPRNGENRFKGVQKRDPHWTTRIHETYIGMYTTEIAAAMAYDKAALEEWGEYAWCNFPGEPIDEALLKHCRWRRKRGVGQELKETC